MPGGLCLASDRGHRSVVPRGPDAGAHAGAAQRHRSVGSCCHQRARRISIPNSMMHYNKCIQVCLQ